MSLPSWFRTRKAHREASPRLNALVVSVVDYMRSHPSVEAFFPQVVAVVGTYCKISSTPINIYDTLAEVPTEETCPDCACAVSFQDESMYVDLYFVVDRVALAQWRRSAA
jgi:hypothetical protein